MLVTILGPPLKNCGKNQAGMRIIQLHNGICGNSLDVFFPWKVGLRWVFLSRTSLRFQHFQWFSMLEHFSSFVHWFSIWIETWICWIFQHFPAFSPQFPHTFPTPQKKILQGRHGNLLQDFILATWTLALAWSLGSSCPAKHSDISAWCLQRMKQLPEAQLYRQNLFHTQLGWNMISETHWMMGWWKDFGWKDFGWTYGWWNFWRF